MTDWRETASPRAQADLDELFSFALEHAATLLRDGNKLVPFAAVVTDEGTDVLPGVADTSSARTVLDRLYAVARQHVEHYRAVAFTAVIMLDGASAVRVEAEHRERIALALRVPYRQRFLGGVRFGTMQLDKGRARLWR